MKTEYHQTSQSQASTEVSRPDLCPGPDCPPALPGGSPDRLPCLYSNISSEIPEDEKTEAILGLASLLSPYHKKAAHTLHVNVERLIMEAASLGHVGFLTLTFKENLTDNKTASRRFNTFNSHFLNADPRFGTKIIVKEPQSRGAWHYHILIQLSQDIRTGFDYEAIKNHDYSSASTYLRQLWKDIREACEAYGFGRSELIPVKSNAEAMGYYLGKYISKGIGQRSEEQKNVRLVNYTKGWTRNSAKFVWNTANTAQWRKKLSLFAKIHGCQDLYQLTDKLGPNWAYRFLEDIINVSDAAADHYEHYRYLPDGTRIDRETGEAITTEFTDPIFKRIHDNDKNKTQLLHAEVLGLVPPKLTFQHWQKTQRKKEHAKNEVQRAKSEFVEFRAWLKTLPPAPF